jgi:hypothetical protein
MIEGGCFCRNIRYAIDDGAYLSVDCHCTMCRRIHSAPYVTWMVVPTEKFRYTGPSPSNLKSSTNGTRYFCPSCGSHVACMNVEHPEIIDIPVGSLDSPESTPPTAEIYGDTRLSWVPAREIQRQNLA